MRTESKLTTTVLVVDDEPKYRRLITYNLQAEGYQVVGAVNGQAAMERLSHREPDLIILDLGLPDMDGRELCKQIRTLSDVPILVLTAMVGEKFLVDALDSGADDYLSKPFSLVELNARIRALLRRGHATPDFGPEIVCGEIRLSTRSRTVWVRDRQIRLSPTEWRLLREFTTHCGEVLTHEYLLGRVWGVNHFDEHEYLRVYVRALREHIEPDPRRPVHLISYIGVGYALHASPPLERHA